MGWFSSKLEKLTKNLADEKIYEVVAAEVANKDIRPGLWAKAWATCGGDDAKAKSFYIKLRAEQLKLESSAAEELIEHAMRNHSTQSMTNLSSDADCRKLEGRCRHCGSLDIARRSDNNQPSWCFSCKSPQR